MARLLLLRHAQTRLDPATSASTWLLTEEGRAASHRIATLTQLQHVGMVLTGNQPKMIETVQPLVESTHAVECRDSEFRETDGEGWFGAVEFRNVVQRFFENPREPAAPDWETAHAASERFVNALEPILRGGSPSGDILVCSGGRVLTAVLARLGFVAWSNCFALWSTIQMPDLATLALEDGAPTRLLHSFGSGLGSP